MMYKYTFNEPKISTEIDKAVKKVLENDYATPDIASRNSKILSTQEMGSLIADYV